MALPAEIESALGSLTNDLADLGYVATADQPSASFGDFLVRFEGKRNSFAIARDRGQFIVHGDRTELEPIGLWRAFDLVTELEPPLLSWLRERHNTGRRCDS